MGYQLVAEASISNAKGRYVSWTKTGISISEPFFQFWWQVAPVQWNCRLLIQPRHSAIVKPSWHRELKDLIVPTRSAFVEQNRTRPVPSPPMLFVVGSLFGSALVLN